MHLIPVYISTPLQQGISKMYLDKKKSNEEEGKTEDSANDEYACKSHYLIF